MASTKAYLDFVLEQCSFLTARPMMGEYLLYYKGRLIGGIYDNRLLIKITFAVTKLIPDAPREIPYEGAKEMILIEDIENKEFLNQVLEKTYNELP